MLLAKPACSTTKERASSVMERHSYRWTDGQAPSYRWRIWKIKLEQLSERENLNITLGFHVRDCTESFWMGVLDHCRVLDLSSIGFTIRKTERFHLDQSCRPIVVGQKKIPTCWSIVMGGGRHILGRSFSLDMRLSVGLSTRSACEALQHDPFELLT